MPLFLVLRVIIYLEQCMQRVWFFEILYAEADSQAAAGLYTHLRG